MIIAGVRGGEVTELKVNNLGTGDLKLFWHRLWGLLL
jgi:hypothetical protein